MTYFVDRTLWHIENFARKLISLSGTKDEKITQAYIYVYYITAIDSFLDFNLKLKLVFVGRIQFLSCSTLRFPLISYEEKYIHEFEVHKFMIICLARLPTRVQAFTQRAVYIVLLFLLLNGHILWAYEKALSFGLGGLLR